MKKHAFHERAFKAIDISNIVPMDIFMILIMTFLTVQARFSHGLRLGLEKSNEETLLSNKKIDDMLTRVRKVVKVLGNINTKFK